jgi:hypothetical protein
MACGRRCTGPRLGRDSEILQSGNRVSYGTRSASVASTALVRAGRNAAKSMNPAPRPCRCVVGVDSHKHLPRRASTSNLHGETAFLSEFQSLPELGIAYAAATFLHPRRHTQTDLGKQG